MDCPLQKDKVCNNLCAWYDWDTTQCAIAIIAESLKAMKYKIAPGY